ncbi:MAG: TrkA family potassium uptake protein [Lachnospiraceae bacterium]|nr:TrkA family potassium uptake protein [Lachnospiraceae bacterium]
MSVREIAVFGLGRMGKAVAQHFSESGGQVIAIDNNQRTVDEIADKVAYAVKVDVNDVEAIKSLSLGNVDVAVITLGENLEASIMAIIACKEVGIEMVYAKAKNKLQGKILEKVGADRIVYPEEDMGERLAKTLRYGNLRDVINLEDGVSIVEADIPKHWIGKTLIDLNIRKKYGFNLIAIRENGKIRTNIPADKPLKAGVDIVIIGEEAKINKILK